jgi:hypothetical protein
LAAFCPAGCAADLAGAWAPAWAPYWLLLLAPALALPRACFWPLIRDTFFLTGVQYFYFSLYHSIILKMNVIVCRAARTAAAGKLRSPGREKTVSGWKLIEHGSLPHGGGLLN